MRRTKFSNLNQSEKKENLPNSGLCHHRGKLKESEKRNKYLGLARALKKSMQHEDDGDTTGALGRIPKELVKGLENNRTSEDYPNYRIIIIGQNTEKSLGNLRFSINQTSVENHQLEKL